MLPAAASGAGNGTLAQTLTTHANSNTCGHGVLGTPPTRATSTAVESACIATPHVLPKVSHRVARAPANSPSLPTQSARCGGVPRCVSARSSHLRRASRSMSPPPPPLPPPPPPPKTQKPKRGSGNSTVRGNTPRTGGQATLQDGMRRPRRTTPNVARCTC